MGQKKSNAARFSGLGRFLQALQSTEPEESSLPSASTCAPAPQEDPTEPPTKRQRSTVTDNTFPNPTDTVTQYTDESDVPDHLRKYFAQRTRLFSRYDEGCLLDEEGWYSVTPEAIADQIAERCRCGTVLDAFCGVGGNAIAFAKTCERVIALDISPTRLALARHNAEIYGVADRIEFILADFLSFARTLRPTGPTGQSTEYPDSTTRKIDVVFLSPPWGGPSYLAGSALPGAAVDEDETTAEVKHPEFTLDAVAPIHGRELFHVARRISRNVAYFLPRNTRLEEIAALLPPPISDETAKPVKTGKKRKHAEVADDDYVGERVEVEEAWMGTKLKALTCYFGGLVAGQAELW
ncbi:S-adenosyl-L-methionine-dependent methyltransferase [Peniophora sp. CONT]|nr:S-adenosyl-L-methionine-dependent methyltransferase [Peniophora sp. CONT]